jgi:hypothetical protein
MAAPQSLPLQGEFGFLLEPLPSPMPDLRDRLHALKDDTRARFLPTTHREKDTGLVFLDYLDWWTPEGAPLNTPAPESKHPGFAAAQLREIFFHHVALKTKPVKEAYADSSALAPEAEYRPARLAGESEGRRALRSKAYEMGDYLLNATTQATNLRQLEKDVKELDSHPRITLFEDLGADHPGLPALFRFFDQAAVRKLGLLGVPGVGYDPFRTVEYGRDWLEEKDKEPRNKYVEDVYTATDLSEAAATRIEYLGSVMTVGSARSVSHPGNKNVLQAAIEDQQNRGRFWDARLREVAAHTILKPIVKDLLEEAKQPPLKR